MPELFHERREQEAEFTKRLNALNAHHRPIIVEAMGTPPNPANVPEELWRRLEEEERRESYWVLLWVMLGAYNSMLAEWDADDALRERLPQISERPTGRFDYRVIGTSGPIAPRPGTPSGAYFRPPSHQAQPPVVLPEVPDMVAVQARTMAATHANRLAQRSVSVTRQKLAQAVAAAKDAEEQTQLIRERIDREFGESRAESIAITETTRAIVNGERIAGHRAATELGWNLERVWQTERDARVCPICQPMHNTTGPWTVTLGGHFEQIPSPPAHPRCRCWLSWSVLNKPQPEPELVA